MSKKYFGFYRGIVTNNDDSKQEIPYRGFIQVFVPQVYGTRLVPEDYPWAEPCLPILGGGRKKKNDKAIISNGLFAVPAIGASVWVGFEAGDIQSPIWFGTWFGWKDKRDSVLGHEIGTECQEDTRSGVKYPDLCVLKSGGSPSTADDPPGMYIRFVGDKRIEIVFQEGQNFIELDAVEKRVLVNVDGWDIELESKAKLGVGGTISLKASGDGAKIVLDAPEIDINASESFDVRSEGTSKISAKLINTFASDSIIHGNAPSASGFEDH